MMPQPKRADHPLPWSPTHPVRPVGLPPGSVCEEARREGPAQRVPPALLVPATAQGQAQLLQVALQLRRDVSGLAQRPAGGWGTRPPLTRTRGEERERSSSQLQGQAGEGESESESESMIQLFLSCHAKENTGGCARLEQILKYTHGRMSGLWAPDASMPIPWGSWARPGWPICSLCMLGFNFPRSASLT